MVDSRRSRPRDPGSAPRAGAPGPRVGGGSSRPGATGPLDRRAGQPVPDGIPSGRRAGDGANSAPSDRQRAAIPGYADAGAPAPLPSTERGLLLALLPLRLFLGATFLYAGLDKLVSPGFLRATGAGSIGSQLLGFTHNSPLTPLIQAFAMPAPVLIGLLIAVGEIAVGLGALAGLLYRLSAIGGTLISLLFFLTASWATHPYYYGPDLPYAAGWLTLALVGRPGPLAADAWFAAAGARVGAALHGRRRRDVPEPSGLDWMVPVSTGRRALLKAVVLGAAAVVIAGAGGVLGALRGLDDRGGLTGDLGSGEGGGGAGAASSPPVSSAGGAGGSAAPSTAGSPATAANVIARVNDVQPRHAVDFQDPSSGDPGVLVRLADGKFVAFDAVCTHAGCTVGYDTSSGLLLCPCHGAAFDPSNQASVVGGPTNQPLAQLPISIDQKSGTISVTG